MYSQAHIVGKKRHFCIFCFCIFKKIVRLNLTFLQFHGCKNILLKPYLFTVLTGQDFANPYFLRFLLGKNFTNPYFFTVLNMNRNFIKPYLFTVFIWIGIL